MRLPLVVEEAHLPAVVEARDARWHGAVRFLDMAGLGVDWGALAAFEAGGAVSGVGGALVLLKRLLVGVIVAGEFVEASFEEIAEVRHVGRGCEGSDTDVE